MRSVIPVAILVFVMLACGGATETSSGGASSGASSSGAASSGGGASSSGGRACTALGCQNGLRVDFTFRDRGTYVFDVAADGRNVACKATLPLPKGTFDACSGDEVQLGLVGSMLPENQQSLGGLTFPKSPTKVSVRAERDGVVLVERTFEPVYTVTPGPNGPGCEPNECRFAKAALP